MITKRIAMVLATTACLLPGHASAESCAADEVEIARTSDYIDCQKRNVYQCMQGAKQRFSAHQRECARQTVAAARNDGYVATTSAMTCAASCLAVVESRKTAIVASCIASCGITATNATRIVDDFVDSPCVTETLKLQKREDQACKALGNR